jgi:hypothetical protein
MDLQGIALMLAFAASAFLFIAVLAAVILFWPIIRKLVTGVVSFITKTAKAVSLVSVGVKALCDDLNTELPNDCKSLLRNVILALDKGSDSYATIVASVGKKLSNIV